MATYEKALELAIQAGSDGELISVTIQRAKAFLEFLTTRD